MSTRDHYCIFFKRQPSVFPPTVDCLSLVSNLVSGLVCHLGWDDVSASLWSCLSLDSIWSGMLCLPPWACLFLVSGLVSHLVFQLVWDAVSVLWGLPPKFHVRFVQLFGVYGATRETCTRTYKLTYLHTYMTKKHTCLSISLRALVSRRLPAYIHPHIHTSMRPYCHKVFAVSPSTCSYIHTSIDPCVHTSPHTYT